MQILAFKGRRIGVRMALATLSLLLTLSVLELALRLFQYDLNPHPTWRFNPQVGWVVDSDTSDIDSVQATGFRHSPMHASKPLHVRRVLILGDSFALATRLPYSRSFPGILESRLNRNRPPGRWQVLNLSVDDWGSAQQYIALKQYGLGYEPDLVVLQTFPFNDFCNNSIGLAHTCSLQDSQRPYRVAEGYSLKTRTLRPFLSCMQWLRLFSWTQNQIAQASVPEFPPPPAETDVSSLRSEEDWKKQLDSWGFAFFKENAVRQGLEHPGSLYSLMPEAQGQPRVRQGWESTKLIFLEIGRQLRPRRIPLLVLVVPFCPTFDPYWQAFSRATGAEAEMEAEFGTHRFEAIFRELGVPVISMRHEILKGSTPTDHFFLSPSDLHISHYGHAQVAKWIHRELVRLRMAESPDSLGS